MDDADLDLAVDGILWCAFGTSGQRCTAAIARDRPGAACYDELQSSSSSAPRSCGSGRAGRTTPTSARSSTRRRSRRSTRYTRDRQGRGREAPHRRRDRHRRRPRKGFYYRPTIFADVEPQMRIAQEEIFGPTTALIPVARLRRGDPRRERDRATASRRRSSRATSTGVPRDARPRRRHHVHQRRHDRRRDAPAVRRHEGHRQRPPRGGPGGARRLHRVEVDLRRLLRQAAARADRQRRAGA